MEVVFKIYFLFAVFYVQTVFGHIDRPCLPRRANDSYVCVCNSTYCDEITREMPVSGEYFIYLSSKSGRRLEKISGCLQTISNNNNQCTLEDDIPVLVLDPSKRYQYIEGYGGAVTDSAAINYDSLVDAQLKKYLIESYFGVKGIEYNMIRVPIGGCDFSTHQYAYNEWPKDDVKLTNFSLADEDLYYKIPMIKDAMNVAVAPIHLLASTWSPPLWMKNPSTISGLTRLRPEFFQTYADYHLKFIQNYAEYDIPIWGVTTTNEPLSGVMSLGHNNRLGWTTAAMGKWIANNLGPTLQNSEYDIKILTGDDQRFTVPLWFNMVVSESPDALKYIDGVAVHFYFDDINPPDILTTSMKDYPDKFILYTESCVGGMEKPSVLLGSWKRATKYIQNIIEDLNYNVTGWIDWNLVLNAKGGPNYIDNYVDSPIIVFPDSGEFVKQPLFYAMAHFSKFMPRGSQRIDVTQANCSSPIDSVAVITPDNNIVTVLHNTENTSREVKLILGTQQAIVLLDPNSLATVEFPNH